jgi:hypothetical protein
VLDQCAARGKPRLNFLVDFNPSFAGRRRSRDDTGPVCVVVSLHAEGQADSADVSGDSYLEFIQLCAVCSCDEAAELRAENSSTCCHVHIFLRLLQEGWSEQLAANFKNIDHGAFRLEEGSRTTPIILSASESSEQALQISDDRENRLSLMTSVPRYGARKSRVGVVRRHFFVLDRYDVAVVVVRQRTRRNGFTDADIFHCTLAACTMGMESIAGGCHHVQNLKEKLYLETTAENTGSLLEYSDREDDGNNDDEFAHMGSQGSQTSHYEAREQICFCLRVRRACS